MKLYINGQRKIGTRDSMIYGHFIEHFHRQIYGGVYDPDNPLSDEDGLRMDVLEAMNIFGCAGRLAVSPISVQMQERARRKR